MSLSKLSSRLSFYTFDLPLVFRLCISTFCAKYERIQYTIYTIRSISSDFVNRIISTENWVSATSKKFIFRRIKISLSTFYLIYRNILYCTWSFPQEFDAFLNLWFLRKINCTSLHFMLNYRNRFCVCYFLCCMFVCLFLSWLYFSSSVIQLLCCITGE